MDLSLPNRLSIRAKYEDLRVLPAGMGLATGAGQWRAPVLDAGQRNPLPGRRRVRGFPGQSAGRALRAQLQRLNDQRLHGGMGLRQLPLCRAEPIGGLPEHAWATPMARSSRPQSLNIPAYGSAGNFTFPDFSQASIFENPPGQYAVRKEAPQFNDTLTKVWGAHTVKMGAFTQNTDNYQSTFSTYQDGNLEYGRGSESEYYYRKPAWLAA